MINQIYSFLLKKGVLPDPVPATHAEQYSKRAAAEYAVQEVDRIEETLGPVAGKDVVDIGGGPGFVAMELARRGAYVTWYDISDQYYRIAKESFAESGLTIKMVKGLIDEDYENNLQKYDLIVNLVCWYYSSSDQKMAAFIQSLARPDAAVYISCNVVKPARGFKLKSFLYNTFNLKIGHPYPQPGKIKKSFGTNAVHTLSEQVSSSHIERIFMRFSAS